ncbi:hypothetical protein CCB80_01295 [Armatimonadetes bacterium Uphvl-Ar1]|nr:hypothetical protein CCB80_01295 [Armatimonadetes bacterium Uphvl-Ar1]
MPVNVPFIDLKSQYEEVKGTLDPAIAEILSTGAYVLGKYNKELEETIANRHGVKHAICVNSGTDALRIAMQACDIGPGDEVITTAFTFVATAETVVQLGAIPVFVDIDRETMCIDPAKIEAAITPKPKQFSPSTSSDNLPTSPRSKQSPRSTTCLSSKTPPKTSTVTTTEPTPGTSALHPGSVFTSLRTSVPLAMVE